VDWNSVDLTSFTPASAPVLPTATLEKYESSVAAHTSAIARSRATSKPTSKGSPPQPDKTFSPTHAVSQGTALSVGAKAGIIVGVAAAVLILSVIGFIIFRQRRKQAQLHLAYSKQPYVDAKPELAAHERGKETSVRAVALPYRDPQELAAVEMPQELADNRELHRPLSWPR
jgi:hypothetical protein